MDREELAWAAGFFDGEGSFLNHTRSFDGQKHYISCRAKIGQRHPLVLERFRAAVGLGKVYESVYRDKPMWTWRTNRFEHTQAVIAMLWLWLSPVKRTQALTVLANKRRGVEWKTHISTPSELTFTRNHHTNSKVLSRGIH